jgi:RsiW-degrading membrane proteinase PrsW (M82 family)
MKNRRPPRSMPSQVIVGLFVVGMGFLFLLDNLNVFDFHRAVAFWPAAFILFGAIKLLDTRSPNGALVGTILIAVGVVMTVNRLGFMHINIRTLWPLLIMGVGGAVIYRAVTGRRLLGMQSKDAEASDEVVDITAILGGFDRRITTPSFRGGEVTAVMGGCMLDLRGSSIEGEAVINVFVLMGGVTLKVPPDWSVALNGTPIMGGFDEKTITAPNNNKRLVIRGYAIMGGVEVRN